MCDLLGQVTYINWLRFPHLWIRDDIIRRSHSHCEDYMRWSAWHVIDSNKCFLLLLALVREIQLCLFNKFSFEVFFLIVVWAVSRGSLGEFCIAQEDQPLLMGALIWAQDMACLWSKAAQDMFSTLVAFCACLSPSLDCELLRGRDCVFTCLA